MRASAARKKAQMNLLDEVIKHRARTIDPACWKSYSGDKRTKAQQASIAQARRDILKELLGFEVRGVDDASLAIFLETAEKFGPALRALARRSETMKEYGAKYSVSDIDRMRTAIRGNPAISCRFNNGSTDSERHVEDKLRTYMTNGTTPEELEAAKATEWEHISARQVTRKMMAEVARDRDAKGSDDIDFLRGQPMVALSEAAAEEVLAGVPLDMDRLDIIKSRIRKLAFRLMRR